MQPGGATEGEGGCKVPGHPPAIRHEGRDRDAASPSSPPFPSPDLSSSKKKPEDEQEEEQEPHPLGSLPVGPLGEILSRVPYRSLCRFKCVSKPWLYHCSDPEILKRCPQTLSGFFHLTGIHQEFHNLSGRGTPMVDHHLPFLPESHGIYIIKQCCSSLLLCKSLEMTSERHTCGYFVCNPATKKWKLLPPTVLSDQEGKQFFTQDQSIFLGFDMAAPSCFVVFAAVNSYLQHYNEAAIYSSETGQWTCVQRGWDNNTMLADNPECVFLNGTMHFSTYTSSVATVDTKGKVWREIEIPSIPPGFDTSVPSIGHSQGRLYAWRLDIYDGLLYVWVLEDYDSGKWNLKHTINFLELFGRQFQEYECYDSYKMFAIHPERNVIFLTDGEKMTVSYDTDNQKVDIICTSGEFMGGIPYTPCFAEWHSDSH